MLTTVIISAALITIRTACPHYTIGGRSDYRALMTFVTDRPGHDRRYAINSAKIETELGWRPRESFETGIRKTVRWYLENMEWVANVTSGAYQEWIAVNYAARG